jgi:hypothetical protein
MLRHSGQSHRPKTDDAIKIARSGNGSWVAEEHGMVKPSSTIRAFIGLGIIKLSRF